MAQVTPAVDDSPILGERDASKLMGELIEAQNQAHYLGLALEIETRELDSITSTHQQPKARLLHVIYTFLRQTEPRPTWSAVVKALNSPAVGLPKIAKRIQEKYINRPTPMLPCSSSSAMTRRPINTSPEQAKVESPYALRGKRSQEQVSDQTDLGVPEPKRNKREPAKKQQRDKAKRDLIQKADEVQEAFKEFVQKDEDWQNESKMKLDVVRQKKNEFHHDLTSSNEELKKLVRERNKLTKDNEELEKERNSLNEELSTERNTLTKMKEELDLERKCAAMKNEELDIERKCLITKTEELDTERKCLAKKNEELKTLSKRLTDQDARITKVMKQKEDTEKLMQRQLTEKDKALESSQEQLEELNQKLFLTQNQLKQMEKQFEDTRWKFPCSIQ